MKFSWNSLKMRKISWFSKKIAKIAEYEWKCLKLHQMGPKKMWARLGLHETYIYASCKLLWSIGSCQKRWKSIKFHANHEIFMKFAEYAEKSRDFRTKWQKWLRLGENAWKFTKMGPKRCGHVWDCTKRIYIRFQPPPIYKRIGRILPSPLLYTKELVGPCPALSYIQKNW